MALLTGETLFKMVQAASFALTNEKARINGLNVFPVPDGDTGTNMALTVQAAVAAVSGETSVAEVAQAMANGALRGARGNSGTILSQIFGGFSRGVKGLDSVGPTEVAAALAAAAKGAYEAVGEPQEGTMLTVMRDAADGAAQAASDGAGTLQVLEAALAAAEQSLERTPELLPVLKEAGVVDAGGEGIVVAFKAALTAAKGGQVELAIERNASFADLDASLHQDPHSKFAIDLADVEHQYCTEFLLLGQSLPIPEIRQALGELGDSLLVVGGDSLLKVHVHTNFPGRALEIACGFGEIDAVSIGNMKVQNKEQASRRPSASAPAERPAGNVGIVAVSWGDGFDALLRSQGVGAIVPGGQTMNPSAGELTEAIDGMAEPAVIVLPNNKNILLSARQAETLTKKRVAVVPTTSLAQAVSITTGFDPNEDLDKSAQKMEDAMALVRCAEVTAAVRDTALNGWSISAGDALGLIDGEIVAASNDLLSVLMDVVRALNPADGELVTLYAGAEVDETDANAHRDALAQTWPRCDVEVYRGGQPVYSYWVSVE